MQYHIFPEPVSYIQANESSWDLTTSAQVWCSEAVRAEALYKLLPEFSAAEVIALPGYIYGLGEISPPAKVIGEQGYYLKIDRSGLLLMAADAAGFRYGADTLRQIIKQAQTEVLEGLAIEDEPVLKQRGLMLDISRGKVYSVAYLVELAKLLAKNRYNVLQLYTEHTFEFTKHPDISAQCDPLTGADIRELSAACTELGIELQANLQSLGHMRRILTRPAYRHLAESPLFWSLNTGDPGSYALLDDLYGELLPLFESDWVNVCCDEPYDLGKGKSAASGKSRGELYFDHLIRVHALAAKYGKKIMVFGDVIKHYPELAAKMPEDILFLDWIYDPKAVYGSPALFKASDRPYWVSPGTGNWNTLFPRLDGSITNIVNLTLEGIRENAEGMLLTDWNDHGGYTQPVPAWFLYSYAGAVAWCGKDPGRAAVSRGADAILEVPGYSKVILELAAIYQVLPIWSKNRSQCVMALFDEPITGAAVRGPEVPADLIAYDLNLPADIAPVLERHSHHPMRPIFKIPVESRERIRRILASVGPAMDDLKEGLIKDQLTFIRQAFLLMLDKLEFSHRLINAMGTQTMGTDDWLSYEAELDGLIRRYVGLQVSFTRLWLDIARPSEMHLSLTYFSQIITRLDYLKDWLSIQREHQTAGLPVDWDFSTYIEGGCQTLPTY